MNPRHTISPLAAMMWRSPAKINFFLQITGKRRDGYHEIFSLMCPVNLFDSLDLEFKGSSITVSCSHPDVPEDESNLAFRAAKLFFDALGEKRPGLHIRVDKKIPVAAGLGGGSSNAASVLKGLNRHFDNPFSQKRLKSIGLSVGADVPFFILCKPALAQGVGEKLEPYPFIPDVDIVLVYPGIKVSTAWVYKNLNLGLTNCKKKLKNAIFKNRGFDYKSHLCNDLEAITSSRHPEIRRIKKALVENGSEAVLMSGSGPTVFGVFDKTAVAEHAAEKIAADKRWCVFVVKPVHDLP